jgi:hypothetical protein
MKKPLEASLIFLLPMTFWSFHFAFDFFKKNICPNTKSPFTSNGNHEKIHFESIKIPLDASIEFFAFKGFSIFSLCIEMGRDIIALDQFENY